MLFSKCIAKEDREEMQKDVERLGGSVVSDHTFTHFVTLSPKRGETERGFVKSLNVLIALAAGMAGYSSVPKWSFLHHSLTGPFLSFLCLPSCSQHLCAVKAGQL